MCIAGFAWQAHPFYPFLLLLNRDEYHNRPTAPVGWWEGGEILGGRDELGGGTWLACSRKGRVAFVTNVLEIHTLSEAKSRGELPVRFLKAERLRIMFEELLNRCSRYEIPIKDMIENIMRDTVKADRGRLPHICSPEWEHGLSSIFVDVETPLGTYGTRSTAVLTASAQGEASFFETYLENDMWKEKMVCYCVEKLKSIQET